MVTDQTCTPMVILKLDTLHMHAQIKKLAWDDYGSVTHARIKDWPPTFN